MIKKLSKCIREYKFQTIASPLMIMLEVMINTVVTYLTARLIDKGIEVGDMDYILSIGWKLVLAYMISLTLGATSARLAAKASTGFAKNLRHDMYYKVQDYSFENIDKFSTASIITRMTTDVQRVQMAFMMIIRMCVRAPLNLICALIMAIVINPKISLVYLVAIPILGGSLLYIATHAHPIFKKVFETYDKLNLVVQEDLHGIRAVKSFVREDHEIDKFKGISQTIFEGFMKAERLLALNMPIMSITIRTCTMLICYFGAKFIVGGTMTTGNLTSLSNYTLQILSSLMMLSMVFVMLTMSKASADRICEILDEESTLVNPEDPIYEVKDGSIEFDHVNFSYSNDMEKLSLKDAHITIKSGETIGIIGGTGSSKSTLVQLIPRLYDVTSGSVKVGGVDVREYDIETLRNEVSMVLQKNELFSGTIKENLRWGNPDATDEQIITACKHSQASEFVENFPDKYDTYIEQGGSNVSGGQKQRLCIARALLKRPKILILDDSTSAVDTVTDANIRKAFREDIPDTTKIIIAQRITSVMDADRIIVMEEGEINGFGTHEELLATNDIYKLVYTSQMQGGISE